MDKQQFIHFVYYLKRSDLPMHWQQKIQYLIGRPIGISFINGQGTSGVLCSAHDGQLYVYEYLYQAQFAMKHYDFRHIQDIHAFPNCPYQNPLY
ncbi:group-specific protein [Bacillus cereus E33L]|uniref:Group-specific protein n=1 Tax=Bacillus cereus (strain ZK / E33L) TaxID=288681 RepID=Q63AA5_BACCZ|nr:group-specific protein [Bacillus cereus E33L]